VRRAGRLLVAAVIVVAIVFAAAIATASGPAASSTTASSTVPMGSGTSMAVSIENFTFVPDDFSVSPGEEVIVTNHDGVTHTLTATPGASLRGTFNTGNIAPGATVSFLAPSDPGTYAFDCSIHNFMTGMLIVR
jgi:plastocyanin